MRCDRVRGRIQDWFDAPGGAPMPEQIRDHVRDCADCRSFVQRWNRIEVELQSVRDQGPVLSPAFRSALDARLQPAEPRRARLEDLPIARYFRPARYALMTASAAVLFVLLAHFAASMRLFGGQAPPPIAIAHPYQADRNTTPLSGSH